LTNKPIKNNLKKDLIKSTHKPPMLPVKCMAKKAQFSQFILTELGFFLPKIYVVTLIDFNGAG
jgi:hypothetical protein